MRDFTTLKGLVLECNQVDKARFTSLREQVGRWVKRNLPLGD